MIRRNPLTDVSLMPYQPQGVDIQPSINLPFDFRPVPMEESEHSIGNSLGSLGAAWMMRPKGMNKKGIELGSIGKGLGSGLAGKGGF